MRSPEKESPAPKAFGAGFWRRHVQLRSVQALLTRSPRRARPALAGLTVYVGAAPKSILLRHTASRRAVLLPSRRLRRDRRVAYKKKAQHFDYAKCWVLATSYSRTAYRRTTIGAAAFHFRVRNGNGWDHCATVTRVRNRTGGFAAIAATQARGRVSGDDGV